MGVFRDCRVGRRLKSRTGKTWTGRERQLFFWFTFDNNSRRKWQAQGEKLLLGAHEHWTKVPANSNESLWQHIN